VADGKPQPATADVKRARLKTWLAAFEKRQELQAALDASQLVLDSACESFLEGDSTHAGNGYLEFVLNGIRYAPMRNRNGKPYIRPASQASDVETFTL
jgi:hypothetical protein